jgi:hypothetical protein
MFVDDYTDRTWNSEYLRLENQNRRLLKENTELKSQLDRAMKVLVFDRTAECLGGYDEEEVEIAMANRKRYILEGA